MLLGHCLIPGQSHEVKVLLMVQICWVKQYVEGMYVINVKTMLESQLLPSSGQAQAKLG